MSLVNVSNLSLTFLENDLFKEIGFQVEPGDRIGLVGPNGTGKTTLLRLLAGKISPDRGEVRIARGTHIGYLPQDGYEAMSGTLFRSVTDAVPGRPLLRRKIREIEAALKTDPAEEEKIRLAAGLAEMHQAAADLDTRFPLHMAEKILMGLGFRPDDFDRPLASLSGGFQMRAALAGILYQNPDLLLLDEPTNHLDLPSVRWLEEFLQGFKGALMLISHDRDFLNRQIRRVISFETEGLRTYGGNYDFYLKAREEEERNLEASARNQEQKVKEARRFIERFKAKASKARQAQSKIKLVKKMELIERHQKKKTIRFSFPPAPRSGRDVLTLQGVGKGFGGMTLYRDLDLRVLRGDRVAIIGPNGAGKTTLLRMVANEMDPDQGRVLLGHGVDLSYYAQHHSEMLAPGNTIIEEVYRAVPHESVSFVRGVCGAFLFSGNDVDKPIGILSGGEKARVSLAKILVRPGNLLVMDEPTNHLDIISSEILIDALSAFNGTLLFVSHNQAFVNRLATKIWDIGDGGIQEYPGTLYEYYKHLALLENEAGGLIQGEAGKQASPAERPSQNGLLSRKEQRREKAEKRQQIRAALKPVQDNLHELEERIDAVETREKELGKMLADPDIFRDKERSLPLLNEYGDVRKKLEELMGRWEFKQKELEAIKEKLRLMPDAG
jgi:ATP-binding cassette subfamily F protein 3